MLLKAAKATLASIGCVAIMIFGASLDNPADYPDKTEIRYAPVEADFICTVSNIDETTIYIVRPDGNEYSFYVKTEEDASLYSVGQEVKVRFSNNGTPYDPEDDYIVREVKHN